MRALISAVALVVAASAWANAPEAPQVRVAKAKPVEGNATEVVTGSFFPSKLLPLGFEVGGRLATSKVKKGDVVKAGQWLGSLDVEIIDAQVAQAQAGLAAAQAGAGMAKDMAARNQKLKAEGGVSDVASRSAETQSAQAQAQVLGAEAGLAQARAGRRKHDLRAPFEGTLIDAPEQTGGMVGPGVPVYVIQQLHPLVVKASIPEVLRMVLKPSTKVRVEAVGSPVSTDDAVVSLVLPSADPQSRRVPIEVTVPNSDGRFVANTLARITIPLGESKAAFVIPATSLGSSGGEHVFVVDKAGQLKRVSVTVIDRTRTEVTLVAAQPLDEVVDYPTSALKEGTKVSRR